MCVIAGDCCLCVGVCDCVVFLCVFNVVWTVPFQGDTAESWGPLQLPRRHMASLKAGMGSSLIKTWGLVCGGYQDSRTLYWASFGSLRLSGQGELPVLGNPS